MGILVVILIIVVIIGALLGGNSFGSIVRKGCGFISFFGLVLILLGLLALGFLIYTQTNSNSQPDNNSALYIVLDDCEIYTQPNIESETLGNLEIGQEFRVKAEDSFNYFYEITDENQKQVFVKKECLKRKME